jgi:hypothetical protein
MAYAKTLTLHCPLQVLARLKFPLLNTAGERFFSNQICFGVLQVKVLFLGFISSLDDPGLGSLVWWKIAGSMELATHFFYANVYRTWVLQRIT